MVWGLGLFVSKGLGFRFGVSGLGLRLRVERTSCKHSKRKHRKNPLQKNHQSCASKSREALDTTNNGVSSTTSIRHNAHTNNAQPHRDAEDVQSHATFWEKYGLRYKATNKADSKEPSLTSHRCTGEAAEPVWTQTSETQRKNQNSHDKERKLHPDA